MKRPDEILRRLLQAAREGDPPAEMPFGFDTRVLARLHQAAPYGSAAIALLARRAAVIAFAVMALAVAGLYGSSTSQTNSETMNEYGIVDSAIQNNLAE